MASYMPYADADFDTWFENFSAWVGAHGTTVGLNEDNAADVVTQYTQWHAAYAAHIAAIDAAKAAKETKDHLRRDTEVYVRRWVNTIQAFGDTTDAQRQSMGITVRDTEPTPIGPPTTRPILILGLKTPQRHEVAFADEGTPTKKAKPAGVRGAEIWTKKGTAPATDADWGFLALDTSTPYVAEYDQSEIGTSVWYRARWVNTTSEPGPWSPTVTAKVPG